MVSPGGALQGGVHVEAAPVVANHDIQPAGLRFQDDVDVVKSGLECGVRVGEYREYEEGDLIECYTLEKLEVTL